MKKAKETLVSMKEEFKVATIEKQIAGFIAGSRSTKEAAIQKGRFNEAESEICRLGFSPCRAEYLSYLAILPAFRGNKLGAELLGKYLIDAKNSGSDLVLLRTHGCEQTNSASRLYEKFGFNILRNTSDKAITTKVAFSRTSQAINESDERPFYWLDLNHR